MTRADIAEMVMKPKMPVSRTLLTVVVIYFFLKKDIYVFAVTKREPRMPPKIPSTNAPQM